MSRNREGPPRAPSPANTAYSALSGLSNYRSDAYRSLKDKDKGVPALPTVDSRTIAKAHFDELQVFLASHIAKEPQGARASAREKLTRLTRQQFQELSTDVYDELVRRNNDEVPFLPLRDDFHPKRNQARQKLATLPKTRFKDLASDVFYELSRRYPEFKEPEVPPDTPGSNYDDFPETPTYDAPSSKYSNNNKSTRNQRPPDSPNERYSPRPSLEKSRPPVERSPSESSGLAYGRRPSNDRRRPSEDDEDRPYGQTAGGRKPPKDNDNKYSNTRAPPPEEDESDYGSPAPKNRRQPAETAAPNTAQSGVVIPNKSTIATEEIQVPYGRDDARLSVASSISPEPSPRLPTTPAVTGGLSALGANLKNIGKDDEEEEYYDKMSVARTSIVSGSTARRPPARDEEADREAAEKVRKEFETKLTASENRISSLEKDLNTAKEALEVEKKETAKLSEELSNLRGRSEDQSGTMMGIQRELDETRAMLKRDRERESRRQEDDEKEIRKYKEKVDRLEKEKNQIVDQAESSEVVEELRADLQNLLEDLKELSVQNDELATERDADITAIAQLEAQLKDYKRKYEQAKTELRSVKATSQLFLQAPKGSDDQMPMSNDGGIPDIHITTFQSSIDSLLTAARSNAPSKVLTPMKAVVNSVTTIIDDIRDYKTVPRSKSTPIDPDVLDSLCERAEATLSNLVTATKTHATSYGLSPVSLLDAATSHVSATITEMARLVMIRKSTKAELEAARSPSANGYVASLKSVDELRSSPERYNRTGGASSPSRLGESRGESRSESRSGSRNDSRSESRSDSLTETRTDSRTRTKAPPSPSRIKPPSSPINVRKSPTRLQSDRSSSNASSPPAIFDTPPTSSRTTGTVSDDSAPAEQQESWDELKPYLETQSEAMVAAIQAVLSAVRSTKPAPNLNENLTQIITIVSSVVAVCNDNIPPASERQGNMLLEELSDHCNRLSEVQSMPNLDKEARQIMAKSSFAIANAMKDLVKL